MKGSWLPIALTITGAVLYHVSSKSVPRGIHPLGAIIGAYVGAILAAFVLAWRWSTPEPFAASFRQANWAVLGVGLGALLIEVGFILAYRAGWPLNSASLLVNVSAAILLIPIGLALFGERFTPGKAAGIVLCLVGLALLSRK
jgi:hypothetical protein